MRLIGMSESEQEIATIEQLTEDFLERCRRGEHPAIADYERLHPELADQIRAFFPTLALVEQLKPSPQDERLESSGRFSLRDVGQGQIGDYRILREVGRGGMGIVYEAEQQSLGRRVALKVLASVSHFVPQQLARFHHEARAAARLHHTNIVPVFGVGEDNGLHYYVMQFISGLGLDQVFDELRRPSFTDAFDSTRHEFSTDRSEVARTEIARSLFQERSHHRRVNELVDEVTDSAFAEDIPAIGATRRVNSCETSSSFSQSSKLLGSSDSNRLYARNIAEIGVQVAEALAYAHEQGILHRDVKPSNLLLDLRANVWVADFGLAKAVDNEDLTETGDVVGTVRYMAPERFSGKCDPRSDIYSLGITLYEMLARRPAFSASDRQQLLKHVAEVEPTPLRQIDASIPRDLETVIQKSIEKAPEDRYQTADALAGDLSCFLEDRPVGARRVRLLERATRWARRNPLPAALVAAVFVLLAAIGSISSILAIRLERQAVRVRQANVDAERNFQAARKAVDDYFTLVSEETLLNEPSLIMLREKLLRAALDYHRDFLRERGDSPDLQAELATSFLRAGSLLAQLGSREEAIAYYGNARDLFTKLAAAQPRQPDFRRSLADCLVRIATVRGFGGAHPETVKQELAQAGVLCEQLRAEDPTDIVSRHFLVTVLNLTSRLEQNAKNLRAALDLCRHSHDVLDEIVAMQPDSPRGLSRMAEAHRNLSMLETATGNCEEGLRLHKRAISILEPLAESDPRNPSYRHGIGKSTEGLAEIYLKMHDAESAVRMFDRALSFFEPLARQWDQNPRYQNELATVLARSAEPLSTVGQHTLALDRTERAMSILNSVLKKDATNNFSLKTLAECHRIRASILNGLGRTKDAAAETLLARKIEQGHVQSESGK